ncbi:MAG: isochorismatase family protein [Proteobacteria bacterium]|nr:isochorismatase family protein [Pseudomonadota bacterium]
MSPSPLSRTELFALVVIDMNGDFVGGRYLRDAALPVPGADDIVAPMNTLFNRLMRTTCKLALFTRDSHFGGEYEKSPESVPFPGIHCAVGTPGHKLVVNPELLEKRSITAFYMNKNVFDSWGTQHTGATEADVPPHQREVYRNLFQITDESGVDAICTRDALFDNMWQHGVRTLAVCGVATDYCVLMFVIGALKRGFRVVLLRDLVRHIVHDVDTLLDMEPADIAAHLNPGTDAQSMAQRQAVVAAMGGKPLSAHNLTVTTSDQLV